MLTQLDSENADRNLTSLVTVLTHTPSTAHNMSCLVVVKLGDGVKDLDGYGGIFLMTITVGGHTVQPNPMSIMFDSAARSMLVSRPFVVPAGNEVVVKVKSPNAADSDVDVTAILYDCNDTEFHLTKASLVNKREHTIDTGVDVIKDDDGTTTLRTLTPSENNGVVTVSPSQP